MYKRVCLLSVHFAHNNLFSTHFTWVGMQDLYLYYMLCTASTWTWVRRDAPAVSPWALCWWRRPWAPGRARTCIPPAGKYRRASRSARSRSRRARSGTGRSTSRSSGCSPWSSCSGSRAWCPLYAQPPTDTERGPHCTARSSAFYVPPELCSYLGANFRQSHRITSPGLLSRAVSSAEGYQRESAVWGKVIQAYHGRTSCGVTSLSPPLGLLLSRRAEPPGNPPHFTASAGCKLWCGVGSSQRVFLQNLIK